MLKTIVPVVGAGLRRSARQSTGLRIAVALLAVLVGAAPAHATPSWVSLGPDGGQSLRITVDPSTPGRIYASTSGGAYRSDDAGVSWQRLHGLIDVGVYGIVVDPSAPATVYAPGAGGQIYKSLDAGMTWTAYSTGISPFPQVLAIDPSNPARLYLGTNSGGVYRSTDGAVTWTAVNTGLCTNCLIEALAVDPVTPATVYATARNVGIFKTVNGGTGWTQVSTASARSLAIDPTTPSIVYAGGDAGMLRSADGGASWTAINSGLVSTIISGIVIDPLTPATLYCGTGAGIHKTVNAGASWTRLTTGLPSGVTIVAAAIDPLQPGTVYATASTEQAVYRTTNGGASWSTAHAGMHGVLANALTIDPLSPSTLYAGSRRSTDGGVTWSAYGPGPPVFAMAFDPVNPANLYDGTSGSGMWRRIGSSWQSSASTAGRYINDVDVDRLTPSTVWAASDAGPLKSVNSGVSWTFQTSGITYPYSYSIAVDPFASSTVFVGTTEGGLHRSLNGGATWSRNLYTSWVVTAIVFDPVTSGRLYAVTNYSVYRSVNGGTTWTGINAGLPAAGTRGLFLDPTNPMILYLDTTAGLYKSTNGGTNWALVPVDGMHSRYVRGTAAHSSASHVVYVGTQNGSVFRLDQECGNGVLDAGEQCDDGNTRDGDCCSSTCQFAPASTVCRAAAGVCDAAEQCSGTSGVCPPDAKRSDQCRAAADACDSAEYCDGAADTCPPDLWAAAGTACRPAQGACDLTEQCTGTSPACPADALEPSTVVCRAAAGACDVAEYCTGSSAECPVDVNPACTPTDVPTDTPTPTETATLTPTDTATHTTTVTVTDTPTHTPLPTDTPSDTPTATDSPTASPTDTPTATATETDTATATETPTHSATPIDTPTATPVDTATPTATVTDTATATDTPTHTPTPTPIDTATPTATVTDTATATDTPTPTPVDTATATQTATATPTATSTPTATPSNSPTISATATATDTRTATRTATATATQTPSSTPTPTATPPPSPHAVLFFSWTGVGKGTTRYAHHYAISGETNASFEMPSAGRVSHLFVSCATAVTTGTHTITLRRNGANTALGCAVSGGATSCVDAADAVDFAVGDELNLKVVNSASTDTPSCRALATLTASGGSAPHDDVITLQTDSESPVDGQFCGMNIAAGDAATTCASASPDDVSMVMPSAGTLTGLAVRLSSNTGNGRTETFTVRNVTRAIDSGLAVTIATGTQSNSTATCTSNCTFSAGDRLAVRFNRTGAAIARTRSLTVSYTGAGSTLASRRGHFATTSRYGGYHLPFDATTPGAAAVAMDRPARLRNLYVHSTAAPTTSFVVTVCSGPTSPPSCSGTRPHCAVGIGLTTCSDTVNAVTVAEGDYVEVQIGNQGDTTGTVGFAVELTDP